MTIRRILAECLDCRIRSGRDGSPPSQTSRDQATSSACLVSRATRTPGSSWRLPQPVTNREGAVCQ